MKWIIDTDPGVDDAAAIISTVRLGKELTAVSVVHGNVPLEQGLTNALRLKDLLGADFPIYRGVERPLLQERLDATEVHGQDGLGDIEWPEVKSRPEEEHAVDMIIENCHRYSGNIGILAIGPLTNIALAVARDRSIVDDIQKLVIMGGNCKGQGNTTMTGEFNFVADPEAAAIVLAAGIDVMLVPWETTAECMLEPGVLEIEDPVARKFKAMSRPTQNLIKQLTGKEGLILPDLVAAAAAFKPEIIREKRKVFAAVETGGHYSRGLTAVDYWSTTGEKPNVDLILKVDVGQLKEFFQKVLK